MLKRRAAWVLVGVVFGLPATAEAQTMIAVRSCRTAPGTTITVPVEVTAASPLAALNVRLRFDPSVLTFVGISGAALLSPSHEVFYATPGDGHINVVVYSSTGATPFTASSGTAVALTFVSKERSQVGDVTDIVFDSGGSLRLVSSDLSDLSGASVPHTQTIGRICFITTVRNWQLYE